MVNANKRIYMRNFGKDSGHNTAEASRMTAITDKLAITDIQQLFFKTKYQPCIDYAA